MEAVRKSLTRLRSGFVLPMSLVVTVLTLTLVGASARYCTTAMATSNEYLSRTLGRLAAQSTIEKVKILVRDQSATRASAMLSGGTDSFTDRISEVIEGVAESNELREFLSDMRWDEAHRATSDTTVFVDIKSEQDSDLYRILATAEVRKGNRKTTITLQEGIRVPLEDTDIYKYAYFVNGDGHLVCKNLVVNGDVRANGDFYLSGVNINGFVYFTNKVELASNAATWWSGKYVTMLTADAYNRAMRGDTWAKARPTDPLKKGLAWEGGYREPLDNTGKITSLGQFLKLLIDYILNRHNYTDGEVPIVDADHETANAPKEKVIRKAGALTMPKIVFDNETENANNHKLLYYEQKAQDARGSLVCSNAYIDANGKVQKLSAKIKVKWQNGVFGADKWGDSTPAEQERTTTFDPTDPANLPEGVTGKEVVNENFEEEKDREAAAKLFPEGSIPVYNALSAANYNKLSDEQKKNWLPLYNATKTKADKKTLIPNPDPVGSIVNGYENFDRESLQGMYNDNTLFNDGKGLLFNAADYEKSMSILGKKDAEAEGLARKKVEFTDSGWQPAEAEFTSRSIPRGDHIADTQYVTVYGYRKDEPDRLSYFNKAEEGYWNTTRIGSGLAVVGQVLIVPILITFDGGYFKKSDLNAVMLDYSRYEGISSSDSSFISDSGYNWIECGKGEGWYSSYNESCIRGYWVLQRVESYVGSGSERTVTGNRVVGQFVTDKSKVDKSAEKSGTPDTVYDYTATYYSKQPAGYIGITVVTNYIDDVHKTIKEVKYEYKPFAVKPEPPAPIYRDLIDTQFVELHESQKGTSSPGMEWTRVSYYGSIKNVRNNEAAYSEYNKKLVDQVKLDSAAEEMAKHPGVDASDVTDLFTTDSGWKVYTTSRYSQNANVWYKSAVSGYVAVELWEKTQGGKHLEYELVDRLVTATEKSQIEAEQKANENVVSVYYAPLHDCGSSQSRWVKVTSDTPGYQDTSRDKSYKGRFALTSDLKEMGESFNEKYNLDYDDLKSLFTAYGSGWSARPSGYGTYYYNPDISGYIKIMVVETKSRDRYGRETYSYSLKMKYVDERGAGGGPEEEGDEELNSVEADSIPVYGLTTVEEARKSPRRWRIISETVGSGYKGTEEGKGVFIVPSEKDTVVAKYAKNFAATAGGDVSEADVKEKIEECLAAQGWRKGYSSGAYSVNPVGRVKLTVVEGERVDKLQLLSVSFGILSTDNGEIGYKPGEKKTYDGDYYINDPSQYWKDHPDEIPPSQEPDLDWPPSIFGPPTELIGKNHEGCVERVLRGIFVQEGNRIITSGDHGYTLPGTTQYLQTPPEDDILTATKSMKTGSKTSELRPFREDPLCQCNRRTEELAGGAADDEGAVFLIGTWDFPIVINGTVVFTSDVLIRGFVTGHGTIVSGRNIHIIGDICYKNPPFWPYAGGSEPSTKGKDRLELVSRGSIVFGNYARRLDNTYVDKAWEKLLSGHYIDGFKNTSDTTSRGVPYLDKDYTREDQNGGRTRQKIVHKNNRLERETVRYYESVVGDYVFLSHNATDVTDSSNNAVPELPDLNAVSKSESDYNDCRLSQFWDFNPSDVASGNTNYFPYATYQSSLIEGWANAQNFTEQDRVGVSGGTPGKSFSYIWKQSTFGTYARNNYASKFGSATKPLLNRIQTVNAVLYASQGVYGVFGGYKTPAVLNGALLAQEESLLPFANMQSTIFSWGTGNDLKMTINWDIRLNRKSADSVKNGEDTDEYGGQMKGSGSDSSEPGDPIPVFWQEVPDSFNEEYHATP